VLSQQFVTTLLLTLGAAVATYLVIAAFIYIGGGRRSRRYRPGRPFEFTSVWFLSSPEHHARAGLTSSPASVKPGRELATASTPTRRPKETGGASDAW